jgi:hypothetical protein
VCPFCGKAHSYAGKSLVACAICQRVHRPEDVCFILVDPFGVVGEDDAQTLVDNGYRIVKILPRLLEHYKRCQFVKFNGWPEGPMDGERERARAQHAHYVDARRRRMDGGK